MTGKIIDRETNGFLLLIIPLAVAVVLIFSAWQWIILLLLVSLALKVWQDYRWSKLSTRINPIFAGLMQEYQGCITPLDLSLKTGLKQKTATEFLERKAGEFGAQKKTIADRGTVYYFITASTLGLILDDSEPREEEVKSLPSSPAVSFAGEEIAAPAPVEAEITPVVEDEPVAPPAPPEEVVSRSDSPAPVSAPEPGPVTNLGQLLREADGEKVDGPDTADTADTSDLAASLGSLNQADLAKRLEVSSSTIGKRKKGMDFTEWSRIKDPDGVAWKYDPKDDLFSPHEDK